MNSAMRSGFIAGSGADPSNVRVVVMSIGITVILLIGTWIVGKIIEAYSSGEMEAPAAIRACVMLGIVLMCILSFVLLF